MYTQPTSFANIHIKFYVLEEKKQAQFKHINKMKKKLYSEFK